MSDGFEQIRFQRVRISDNSSIWRYGTIKMKRMTGVQEMQHGCLADGEFTEFCCRHGIQLAMLFGSHSKGLARPDSDWDFAFWLEPGTRDASLLARKKRAIIRDLCGLLGTSRVDVVLLNFASPLMRYQVARHGRPVYQDRDDRFASFVSLAILSYSDGNLFSRAERLYLKRSRMVDPEVLQRKLAKLWGYLEELPPMTA